MGHLGDFLRLGRPHFLLAGLAFVALGAALARHAGAPLDAASVALAQAVVTLTQWGVHYGNEAHDVAADAANARRTRLAGGSGLIVAGRVRRDDALLASRVLFALAVASASLLAWQAPASAPISAALVVLAWAYSAPPLRLCARGLGELATGLVVALLVPALVAVPAGVAWRGLAVLAPLVLQVAAVVLVLSLPDMPGDAAAGKRTLALRLGARASRRVLQSTWLLCGLATMAAVLWGAPPATMLAGGAGFTLAVALPVLVLRQRWDALALTAVAVAALQWALTMAWLL